MPKPKRIIASADDDSIPRTCQHFADAIDRLNEQLQRLEDELSEAGPARNIILARIRALKQRIALEERLLQACIQDPPKDVPRPQNFISNFTGVVTVLTDNGGAPGPFTANTSFAMSFSPDRKQVSVVGLVLRFGSFTAEQSFGASGTFDPGTGALSLPIRFTLRNLPAPDPNGTADFPAPGLTTEDERPVGKFIHTGGFRLDRSNGQIVLVGTSTVSDNVWVGGTNIEMVIAGVLAPLP